MNRAGAYETLQLSENAHPVLVTQAFRVLAAMYHPDNVQSADRDEFERVVEAYRLLSDPVRRAAYDRERSSVPDVSVRARDDNGPQPATERRLRMLILTTLYNMRRTAFEKSGLSLWVLVQTTDSSLDEVRFTLWYLRGKKLIEMDHDDCVVITVAGVDLVEQNDGFMSDLPCLPEPGATSAAYALTSGVS
jgi:curved DNA-binding protein CbpA